MCSVDAHDTQLDVRFMGDWQSRLRDDALNSLFVTCNTQMKNRKVGKGVSKGR